MLAFKRIFLIISIIFLAHAQLNSWGFWAHKTINRIAVFTLPPEIIGFYKQNIEYITAHAVDPDKRRYGVEGEAPRHYIDIDHYGVYPFDSMPRKWKDAVAKYTEDTLMAYGIVPWHIERMYYQLVKAFKEKDANRILRLSTDVGHYIGDAHVPLHTTLNYNGQMTNQVGIHGLLETRIPELFASDYDFFVGKAIKINDPLDMAWTAVLESAKAVDSVFKMEILATQMVPEDQKYVFEERGRTMMKNYSTRFTKQYSDLLNGLVERRMRTAILRIGSFWYSAWVDAGQPDLSSLTLNPLSPEELKQIEEEEKLYQQGKIKGRIEAD